MMRFMLPSKLTVFRLRMPDPVTVPKRMKPAPPSTGIGTAATTSPRNGMSPSATRMRSEEHTSELQSRFDLVCRLLLEKKNKTKTKCQQLLHTDNRDQ